MRGLRIAFEKFDVKRRDALAREPPADVFANVGRDRRHRGEREPGPLSGRPLVRVFLSPEREGLRRRIDARFGEMIAAGALEEVRRLAARRLDPTLPAMKAHGVPWLIRHLHREISLEEAAAGAIMDTRRYAKRQVTWFRNQMTDWPAVPAEEAYEVLLKQNNQQH